MCFRAECWAVLMTAGIVNAWAVDGIAVTSQLLRWHYYNGGDIMRYDIKDNRIVKATKILNGAGGNESNARVRGRFPSINKTGSQAAFFRHTTDSSWFVSVMDLDGSNMRNLVRIPQTVGYDGKGYLYWAKDNWVYYIMGGDNSNTKEGNRHLWRVNVDNPAQNEEVVVFQYRLWQWGMSADATRMILRVGEAQGAPSLNYRYQVQPGNGSITSDMAIGYGVGCGCNMAPSGKWMAYLQGGSHTWMAIVSWENFTMKNGDLGFSSEKINELVEPATQQTTHCWSTNMTITAGYGMDSNRWSSNSDRWMCLQMGYPEQEGGSGRYSFCGSNQVLFNWVDSSAINVSQVPRSCIDNSGFGAGCDVDRPDSVSRLTHAGDFFVTAPLTDVNADLREYVTVMNRRSGMYLGGNHPIAAIGITRHASGAFRVNYAGAGADLKIVDIGGRTVGTVRTDNGAAFVDTKTMGSGVIFLVAGCAPLRASALAR